MHDNRKSLSKEDLLVGRNFSVRKQIDENTRKSDVLNDVFTTLTPITAAMIPPASAAVAWGALNLISFVYESQAISNGLDLLSKRGATDSAIISGLMLSTALIIYGWRQYSAGHAMKALCKEENDITTKILKNISPKQLQDAVRDETLSVTGNALKQLIENKMFEGAYPYQREGYKRIISSGAKAISPFRPIEVLGSLAQAWFSPLAEQRSRLENFFSQHTRFDVNMANLALHMSATLGLEQTQRTLSIYDKEVLKVLNDAGDILPFFERNKISLKTMLDSLQKAIGPDAPFLFDMADGDPKQVLSLHNNLIIKVQEMIMRQSRIHNIGQTLLEMYSAMLSGVHSEFTPNTVKLVVFAIKDELDKERIAFNTGGGGVCARDPDRKFKYQSLLDACDKLLAVDLTKKLPIGHDPIVFAFKHLFPIDGDENSPMHPTNGRVAELTSNKCLEKKTQQHTYAIAMSDAIKSLLRESKVLSNNVVDNPQSQSPDAFMNLPDAVNSISKRIMQRVFVHSITTEQTSARHLQTCREEDALTKYKP